MLNYFSLILPHQSWSDISENAFGKALNFEVAAFKESAVTLDQMTIVQMYTSRKVPAKENKCISFDDVNRIQFAIFLDHFYQIGKALHVSLSL